MIEEIPTPVKLLSVDNPLNVALKEYIEKVLTIRLEDIQEILIIPTGTCIILLNTGKIFRLRYNSITLEVSEEQ